MLSLIGEAFRSSGVRFPLRVLQERRRAPKLMMTKPGIADESTETWGYNAWMLLADSLDVCARSLFSLGFFATSLLPFHFNSIQMKHRLNPNFVPDKMQRRIY